MIESTNSKFKQFYVHHKKNRNFVNEILLKFSNRKIYKLYLNAQLNALKESAKWK